MPPTPTAPPTSLVPPVGDGPKPPGRACGAEPDVAGDSRSERRKTHRLEARVRQARRELERSRPPRPHRAPTTSYDVDIYHPKANDTWESISREYFSDPKYAAALRAYNQNRALRRVGMSMFRRFTSCAEWRRRRPLRGLPRPAPLRPSATTGTRPESARSAPGPIAFRPATA